MGPVITPESRARIEALIDQAIRHGARAVVDGLRALGADDPLREYLRP